MTAMQLALNPVALGVRRLHFVARGRQLKRTDVPISQKINLKMIVF
jgi:hypothetical protein